VSVEELVVCSLESWDEIWRRNQLVVDGLLRRNPGLRVLFVEPPTDITAGLRNRTLPHGPVLRRIGDSGRLWGLRPIKALPRSLGSWADRSLGLQVRLAARKLRFGRPVLWVNDLSYAWLVRSSAWPSIYDITDDWLLEPGLAGHELSRRRRLDDDLVRSVQEVVVCSPALARSRSASRPVNLIPNGVDVDHFTTPRPRPADLPPPPVALYVGTLHDERIDVDLVAALASGLPGLNVVLIGPDALTPASRARLVATGVQLFGPRPYADVPAYLQHADVMIVPHKVTPFTESLDPIKAYECLAVGRPVVATEVAGFRELGEPVRAVPGDRFVAAVADLIGQGGSATPSAAPPAIDWTDRVLEFEDVLERATRST
jgi:teichuronic acid biosynthesis glycosyltransferase TuaH